MTYSRSGGWDARLYIHNPKTSPQRRSHSRCSVTWAATSSPCLSHHIGDSTKVPTASFLNPESYTVHIVYLSVLCQLLGRLVSVIPPSLPLHTLHGNETRIRWGPLRIWWKLWILSPGEILIDMKWCWPLQCPQTPCQVNLSENLLGNHEFPIASPCFIWQVQPLSLTLSIPSFLGKEEQWAQKALVPVVG